MKVYEKLDDRIISFIEKHGTAQPSFGAQTRVGVANDKQSKAERRLAPRVETVTVPGSAQKVPTSQYFQSQLA